MKRRIANDEVHRRARRRSRSAAAMSPRASTHRAPANPPSSCHARVSPSAGSSSRSNSCARVVVPALDRLVDGPQLGSSCFAPPRVAGAPQIARRRPVHARDLHVAAERDRADSVLDTVHASLHDRRRRTRGRTCAASSPRHAPRRSDPPRGSSRAAPARRSPRRQRPCAGFSHQLGRARAGRPRRSSSRSRAGAPSTRPRTSSTSAAMSRKPMRPSRNALHRLLVRGVVRAGVGPAALAGLAGEGKHAERLLVGLEELERPGGQVERRHRRRRSLGIGQRVRDRDAHVGIAEMRDRRAVAEAHEPVHDRGRVHHDLDAVVRRARREVRLDHLEPLVCERRGVDRDLRAHRPRRVRERLLRGHVGELVACPPAERPAARRQHDALAAARAASTGRAPSARCRPAAVRRRPARVRRRRGRRPQRGSPCSRARASRRARAPTSSRAGRRTRASR